MIHIIGFGEYCLPRVALAFIAMIAADKVTNHYKKLELITNTTMRGMPMPVSASKTFIDRTNVYYAISQLFATAGVLNISQRWETDVELAFLTLFAIQISALLMTLVRKSILEPAGWHLFYGISLGLSWVLACTRYAETSSVPSVAIRTLFTAIVFYNLRFRLNMNKYFMWTVFTAINVCFLEKGYSNYPYERITFELPAVVSDIL
jgi:hypothetical protein